MKITNTTTNESIYVNGPTIEVLNILAAKALNARSEENKEGYFYCSLSDIAKLINKTITTAQHHVSKLRNVKVIEIRPTGPGKSIYKINPFKVSAI